MRRDAAAPDSTAASAPDSTAVSVSDSTTVCGEVAELYDRVRPGYPPALADAILAYHGGPPRCVVEVGAGTGKGTELLWRLGAPVTCVEADPRMAAVIRARLPGARVVVCRFEAWRPPPGGVPLLAAAMAWHLLDPAERNRLAHAAIEPGGTLAIIAHKYDCADPGHARRLADAWRSVDATIRQRPERWFHRDVLDSGLFTDVALRQERRALTLDRHRYLQLAQTFTAVRRRTPQRQAAVLAALGAAVDAIGGGVTLDLRTTLVLARRPGAGAA